MPTYVVKPGDSLSKIAKAHGIGDWRAIYNDPANASFRALRPNPNLIQPGDSIVISGGGTASSGAATTSSSSAARTPTMGPPSPTADWIVVATDGTCSEEAYNTTYRRDANNVAQVASSDAYRTLAGPVQSNRSFCKKFHDDAYVLNREFIAGGSTAGFWVMDKVREGTNYLSVQITKNPAARICLVGHSRGGMVAVLIAKWLEQQSVEVDFLGLYDAVDRAPNTSAAVRNAAIGGATGGGVFAAIGAAFGIGSSDGMDASVIPANVINVRHALRSSTVGSRWWFGNTSTEWAGASGSGWKREFRASHGAIGGAVPHALPGKSFFQGNIADDSGWEDQDLTETENLQGGRDADNWIREGARSAGVPI